MSDMSSDTPAWLVLLYQAPTRPSSARVRIWRRLQEMGAVQVRQAAYVLPNRDQPREDLQWLKTEIVGLGGQATVLVANAVDAFGHDDIVDAFRLARAPEVADRLAEGRTLVRRLARRRTDAAARAIEHRESRAYVERCRALAAITFFDTPGMADLEALVEQLSRTRAESAKANVSRGALDVSAYRKRQWVTRPRPGVDRMASAWLIRTFIDPEARFAFADRPGHDAVPFDMFDVEFGHQGAACTFEVLRTRFGIETPAVEWIARIVHDIDLRDHAFNEPEGPGVALMVDGLRRAHPDDADLLDRGIALFESLARGFQTRDPAAGAPARGARSAARTPRPRSRT